MNMPKRSSLIVKGLFTLFVLVPLNVGIIYGAVRLFFWAGIAAESSWSVVITVLSGIIGLVIDYLLFKFVFKNE